MQRRFTAASLVLAAGLSLSLVGCGEVNKLKARKAYKQAIEMYKQQDYKSAAERYKQAIDLDPELNAAYFYLANSYDNQFKATKRGDPTNDAYLTQAINYYKVAAEKDPVPSQRKLAMQFLVSDYGTEKMNDPAQAEPIIQKMIEGDPSDLGNYYALAKLYDDAGQYEQEEQVLQRAQQIKPKDPGVYGQLAGFYNKQGDFDKTIEAYEEWKKIEPTNPEVYYTIGSFFWDKSTNDRRLKDSEKRDYANKGLAEIDQAIKLKPDYFEAVNRKNLLYRTLAGLEKSDRARYDDLMKKAEQYYQESLALQKKKAAGLIK